MAIITQCSECKEVGKKMYCKDCEKSIDYFEVFKYSIGNDNKVRYFFCYLGLTLDRIIILNSSKTVILSICIFDFEKNKGKKNCGLKEKKRCYLCKTSLLGLIILDFMDL